MERGKLTTSLTTPHAPPPKRKRQESEKGFNTKYERQGSDNKTGKGSSRWKASQNNTAKTEIILLGRTSIRIGKRHMMESRTMWLKNEKRRNTALVLAWTTTCGENAASQSQSQ